MFLQDARYRTVFLTRYFLGAGDTDHRQTRLFLLSAKGERHPLSRLIRKYGKVLGHTAGQRNELWELLCSRKQTKMPRISKEQIVQLMSIFMLLFIQNNTQYAENQQMPATIRRRRMLRRLRVAHHDLVIDNRRRKRSRMILMMALSLLYSTSRVVDPDVRKMPQYHTWWEEYALPHFTDREWLRNFRMKRASFELLCRELQPALPNLVGTNGCKPIPLEKRVAIAIWRLATPCEFRTIGYLFGVGRSTACKIVHEVCAAIITVIYPQYVKWPTGRSLHNNMYRPIKKPSSNSTLRLKHKAAII